MQHCRRASSDSEFGSVGGSEFGGTDIGALRANGLVGQVGSHEARIDAVGKADGMACLQTQGLAAIDSLDPVGLGSAVRKGGQNEYAGHETDRVGL